MLSARISWYWRALVGTFVLLMAVSRANGSEWYLFSTHPYPFMGSIQQKSSPSGTWKNICGCSLITSNWALTSADCALATKSAETRIIFNALDISADSKEPKLERRIDKIVMHPNFDEKLNANNIALIKLQKQVGFEPALLDFDNLNLQEKSNVLIMGWGDANVSSNGSNCLQEAKVHLKAPADCEVQYENFDRKTQLCIGDPERGVSACYGDMGGPVLLNGKTLIGVMTTVDSEDCLKKNTVAVRVEAFKGFIQEVTKEVAQDLN